MLILLCITLLQMIPYTVYVHLENLSKSRLEAGHNSYCPFLSFSFYLEILKVYLGGHTRGIS